ncbi:bifunctional proline dehydrogenase/L-glutamate gamma-semialdehyde dehydrogenase [Wenyingzhuangia sp. 1_MG-2023]|nr:bifunctional proline dehydrogenase/L-glutamate gamma-semialdehyde dehydrogenase [Wenyingzhuangia sp. 1_MG-2023]
MSVKTTQKQLEKSLILARRLQEPQQNSVPNLFSKRIGPIIEAPEAKTFLIRMMDTSFRSSNYSRVSEYVTKLLNNNKESYRIFSGFEKVLIGLYNSIGNKFPTISIPLMLGQIKSVTQPILFFVGDTKFIKQAQKRKSEGVVLNVNLIGEALIGEEEAKQRIENYCSLLRQEDVDYISIKASTISSQIKPIAFEKTVAILVEKLSVLYHEILKIEQETGRVKFVNLDMEEYRDLEITLATFMNTLDLPEFKNLRAGIVLQAYLPDSYKAMLRLQKWALTRVENGGAPVKVRLVKGANLEMEKTEASFEDWPLATYNSKLDVDANYKKMLLQMLRSESAKALNVGIASHNIFDLAFGLNLVKEQEIASFVDFEMLEGMANETVYELLKHNVNLLLYTPIVKKENYNSAIAYLVRRLDEGTQSGNFLKEGFQLQLNSEKWKSIEQQFIQSIECIETVSDETHRNQNRAVEKPKSQTEFSNVPNTDWVLSANRKWISEMKIRWENPLSILGNTIPVVAEVANKERKQTQLEGWNGMQPWTYEIADVEDYKQVIAAGSDWYDFSVAQRAELLRAAALEMEKNRADLIGVAVAELGKTVTEVDVEVSEAIDFANYYAQNSLDLVHKEGITCQSKSINLVLSPWNFPIAIPIGGVLASLAAGKRVILKPSQNAAACGYLIARTLWDAGIPKSAFSFLPTDETVLDSFLTDSEVFDAVILTGGTDTAKFLLNRTPKLKLFAETGGKNATIITALSDREQGIKNVVQSAFGNAGQKCSATSLLILEEEVFNDAHFKQLLKDATESKTHGSPWNLHTDIGPLAVKINDKLKYVLENTPEKQWLVKPTLKDDFFLSPGIKWGITKEDYEYNQELFGPILCVMKAKNLKQAVRLVNNLDYGLTSGIESLDPSEVDFWAKKIKAGNLYANRSTTGAIVQRQPFGGMKASCYGFGMKAGGPNYVVQFLDRIEEELDLKTISESYQKAYDSHFSKAIDYVKLRGQHNTNIYLKPRMIVATIDAKVTTEAIFKVKKVAEILKIPVSFYATELVDGLAECIVITQWQEIAALLGHDTVFRALNYDGLDDEFLKLCHQKNIHIYHEEPSNYGRYELLNYLTEQNRSINYHRYGNLMGEQSVQL